MIDEEKPGPTGIHESSVDDNQGISVFTIAGTIGPIGLKDNNAKSGGVSQGNRVLNFARRHIGNRVGSGECYDLADQALRNARAKSAPDYGVITSTADYVWGREVELEDAQPGDIIQFRDYQFDRRVDRSDGSYQTDSQERPHHTGISYRLGGNGAIIVLEQNAPVGSQVHQTQLYFSNTTTNENGTRTTITIQGQVWFYRPQPQ